MSSKALHDYIWIDTKNLKILSRSNIRWQSRDPKRPKKRRFIIFEFIRTCLKNQGVLKSYHYFNNDESRDHGHHVYSQIV